MKPKLLQSAKATLAQIPILKKIYRHFKNNNETYKLPKATPMGFKLAGNELMETGQFEPDETLIADKLMSHADIVINIGANIGYYCCLAIMNKKQVIAFEPIPQNLQYLIRNIKANNWEQNIEIYPMALSNRIGIIEIYGAGTGASLIKGWANIPETHKTFVPSSTLNNALGTRFENKKCFIIVDIEGAEKFMLEGASTMIDMTPKPIWMMEISITEHQPDGIAINPNLLSTFKIFWDNNYEAWTADKHCRIVNSDEIKQIVNTGKDTLLTHNFLFIEKNKKNDFLN